MGSIIFNKDLIPKYLLTGGVAIWIGFSYLTFDAFQVGAFADDARYIALARSLAQGKGYYLDNYPFQVAETVFPPGYPFLLSLIHFFAPSSFFGFKFLSWLTTLGSLLLLWFVGTHKHLLNSNPLAIGFAVLLYALHPWVIGASSIVMTEAPFTFLSLAGVASILFVGKCGDSISKYSWLAVAAVLQLSAVMIRSVGIGLVLASLAFLGFRRKYREMVFYGCLAFLLYLPALLFNQSNSGGGIVSKGYSTFLIKTVDLQEIFESLINLADYVGFILPSFLLPLPGVATTLSSSAIPSSIFSISLGLIFSVAIVHGLVKMGEGGKFILCYLIFYVAILSVYRHPEPNLQTTARYLLPLLPLTLLGLLETSRRILSQSHFIARNDYANNIRSLIGLCILSAVIGVYIMRDVQAVISPIRERMTNLQAGTSWIATNSDSDALVAAPDPISRYLYTERRTVDLPGDSIPAFIRELVKQEISFVIVAPNLSSVNDTTLNTQAKRIVIPTINRYPNAFELVFVNYEANVSVYHVIQNEAYRVADSLGEDQ